MGSDFLGVRFSVQWLNRFASIYLEDPSLSPEEAGQVGALQMRVIEALAFEKNLLQLCLVSRRVEGEVDQEAATTYLAASNTSYSSTNLPRMGDRWGVDHFGPATRPFPPWLISLWRPLDSPAGDLTAHGIRLFLQKLGDTSAAALMTGPEEIPHTRSKIEKVAVETWVRPGENPCGIQRGPSGVGVCCCSPRWRGAWPSARPVRAGEGTLRSTVSGGTQCYDET